MIVLRASINANIRAWRHGPSGMLVSNEQIKRGVCVHYVGVVALILSVLTMAIFFIANFGDLQTFFAAVSLVASAVAAGVLFRDPAAAR